ncbi:MAG: hypothetical protein US49_C0005G0008 [candidate division TM6 bacterium GW2011_GWF2_37_49]|nr:MAG: hypothetical protein US49_C0005G0008 [candidate division TM6 bacterium GW2011_GWF2_37_49]
MNSNDSDFFCFNFVGIGMKIVSQIVFNVFFYVALFCRLGTTNIVAACVDPESTKPNPTLLKIHIKEHIETIEAQIKKLLGDGEYSAIYEGVFVNNRLEDKYLIHLNRIRDLFRKYKNLHTSDVPFSDCPLKALKPCGFVRMARLFAITCNFGATKISHECQVYFSPSGNWPKIDIDPLTLYKIHLMPIAADVEQFWVELLQHAVSDGILNRNIIRFKILPLDEADLSEYGLPRIVFYFTDKNKAQAVLDKLYEIYRNTPGSGIFPRFNEKVTDLIYFAHGDREAKIEYIDEKIKDIDREGLDTDTQVILDSPGYSQAKIERIKHAAGGTFKYETPEMVYYSQEYGEEKYGAKLPDGYFHLKNPAKQ